MSQNSVTTVGTGAKKKKTAPQPKQSEGTPSQSKNIQETKERDVAKLISEIHEQIVGCVHSGAKLDDISLLKEIKDEIQKITRDLHEISGRDTETDQNQAKQTEKKLGRNQSAQSNSKSTTITLHTSAKDMEAAHIKTSGNLTTCRRELREINQQVLKMSELLGLQLDTKNNDREYVIADVKGMIQRLEQKNAELRDSLNVLEKTIESNPINMDLQQNKKPSGKPKTEKRGNNKDSKVEKKSPAGHESETKTIHSAVNKIKELQEYKRQMDALALRVIHIGNQKEDRQSQLTVTLSNFEEAIKDMDAYISKLKKMPDRQLQLEEQTKELSEKLKLLEKAVMPSEKNLHENKNVDGKFKKDKRKTAAQESKITPSGHGSNITTISTAIARFDEMQNDQRELNEKLKSLEELVMPSVPSEKKFQDDKRVDEKSKKDKAKTTTEEQKPTVSVHESNITTVSTAIARFGELQKYQSDLEYKIVEVSHFAIGLQNFMAENINSNTSTPEPKKEQNKRKNSKDDNTNKQLKANNPYEPVNSVQEAVNDFQKYMNVLNGTYGGMKDEIVQLKTTLKHLWNTATSASNYVRQVTEKKVERQPQFKIENAGLHENKEMRIFGEEIQYMVNKVLNCTDDVQKLKKEVDFMQKENDSLQQRLSKIAGEKLTEGNPDITNLGDPNRPMKIGEWFSELYDNEWTDAMDLCLKKLGNKSEEDAILQALYKTLMICHRICTDKSTQSIAKAKSYFEDAAKELMVNGSEVETMKHLIDKRKLAADSASKQLLKEIQDGKNPDATKLLEEIDNKSLSVIQSTPFFSHCLTLCWKMVVQNPPLVLLAGPPQGKEFDRNKFREYTSSGTKVVFTVWPALLLHDNGPLLVKGVVKVK